MVDPSAPPSPQDAFIAASASLLANPTDLVKVTITETQSSFYGNDGSHFALRAGANMVVPRHVADAMIAQKLAEEV